MEPMSAETARYALELAKYLAERASAGHDTCLSPTDMELASRGLISWVLASGWPESIVLPLRAFEA